jgi:alkanesulfonate monooxygenase SsuD/methylene tetrahydromethanopterin reductase-like flavin-dependent oxidoreductase (luciferase family)
VSSSLGVVFPARAPAEDLPAFARRAEQQGYTELWVVEDCFLSGGLAMAATALAATERIHVGIGLLPALVRNPAITAMEISTIARIHPNRLTVAFGHGVSAWMTQIGARPARRLGGLKEVVIAVRSLLAGDLVTSTGTHVTLDAVSLADPPPIPPRILIGTTGPKGVALAGRYTDGLLVPEGCGQNFIAAARTSMLAASSSSDSPRSPELIAYCWLRLDDDEARARQLLGGVVSEWADSGLFPDPVAAAGVNGSLEEQSSSRELADELGIVGTPADCAQSVARFSRAGVARLILAAIGPDYDAQYERFASTVLPTLTVDPPTA